MRKALLFLVAALCIALTVACTRNPSTAGRVIAGSVAIQGVLSTTDNSGYPSALKGALVDFAGTLDRNATYAPPSLTERAADTFRSAGLRTAVRGSDVFVTVDGVEYPLNIPSMAAGTLGGVGAAGELSNGQ